MKYVKEPADDSRDEDRGTNGAKAEIDDSKE